MKHHCRLVITATDRIGDIGAEETRLIEGVVRPKAEDTYDICYHLYRSSSRECKDGHLG